MTSTLLTLPSNASLEVYPTNVTSDYRVQLAKTIRLRDGQYEVALAGFIYPRTWYNFDTRSEYAVTYNMAEDNPSACSDVNHSADDDDDPEHTVVPGLLRKRKIIHVPPGHYVHIDQVLRIVNNEMSKGKPCATFSFNDQTERLTVNFKPGLHRCKYSATLTPPLAERLGWPRRETVLTGAGGDIIEAPGVVKLDTTDLIYVHCDIASDSHMVGDVENCLLRVVPVFGKHGAINTYEPTHLDWLPVRWTEFRTARVLITDSFGKRVPLEWGICTVKLLLRKRSPFGA